MNNKQTKKMAMGGAVQMAPSMNKPMMYGGAVNPMAEKTMMAKGGMVKANCGASVSPAQKAKK